MAIWLPALALVVLMLSVWAASLALEDVSIVDPVWGPAFGVVALAVLASRSTVHVGHVLVAALTLVWGGRLGIHLALRKARESGEDRRYAALRARRPTTFWIYSLFVVFGLQGVLVGLVGLPIEFLPSARSGLSWLWVPGVLVWALGFGFETIGDAQLTAFKADPANRGKVMDRGLWRYTRHPNYFGDACVWWGLWLVALSAGTPVWTVVGPLVMTWLLARGSGKPTLERDIAERRPDYVRYIETTSGFVPLPPRAAPSRPVPAARGTSR